MQSKEPAERGRHVSWTDRVSVLSPLLFYILEDIKEECHNPEGIRVALILFRIGARKEDTTEKESNKIGV